MTRPSSAGARRLIFHIVGQQQWQVACERGRYAPPSLAEEGFVHFSYAEQVAGTANARFADQDGLIVLELDPAALAMPVVDEDLYGAGQLFPHVYSAIETALVRRTHPLTRDAAGQYQFAAE